MSMLDIYVKNRQSTSRDSVRNSRRRRIVFINNLPNTWIYFSQRFIFLGAALLFNFRLTNQASLTTHKSHMMSGIGKHNGGYPVPCKGFIGALILALLQARAEPKLPWRGSSFANKTMLRSQPCFSGARLKASSRRPGVNPFLIRTGTAYDS